MDDYVHRSEHVPVTPSLEMPFGQSFEEYNSDSEGSDISYEQNGTKDEGADIFASDAPKSDTPPRPSRRMSMRMPSFKAFHVSVIDEQENATFLEELTHIITEFPVPPSHEHAVSTQTSINTAYNNITDLVGMSSKTAIKVVSGGWGAVAKFAGKLTSSSTSMKKSAASGESGAVVDTRAESSSSET